MRGNEVPIDAQKLSAKIAHICCLTVLPEKHQNLHTRKPRSLHSEMATISLNIASSYQGDLPDIKIMQFVVIVVLFSSSLLLVLNHSPSSHISFPRLSPYWLLLPLTPGQQWLIPLSYKSARVSHSSSSLFLLFTCGPASRCFSFSSGTVIFAKTDWGDPTRPIPTSNHFNCVATEILSAFQRLKGVCVKWHWRRTPLWKNPRF